MSKKGYGRFPPVLSEEVVDALQATDSLGEERTRLLNLYRVNRARCIAAGGLDADFKGVSNGIGADVSPDIQRLDEAFQKLHAYRAPGGAGRYLSKGVASEFGKQGGRPPLHDDETILAEIKGVLASQKGEKKLKDTDIIASVQERLAAKNMPEPRKTKLSSLIKSARAGAQEKIR